MKLLVSACLLGCPCRYDGRSKPNENVLALLDKHTLIPVCPEQLGGLPTPRPAAERKAGGVFTKDGADVSGQYHRGGEEAVRLARLFDCDAAILKARSPACGKDRIYDGSFSGTLTDGHGAAAQALLEAGIRVLTEEEVALL